MNTAENIEVHMKHNTTDTRLALLEQANQHMYQLLQKIDHHFEKVDDHFNKIDERFYKMQAYFDKIDDRFHKMEGRTWANFYWLLGTMFTLFSVLCGMMVKGFGWMS